MLTMPLAGRLGGVFQEVGAFPQGGAAMLAAACRLGLEGVVSKRRDSRYGAGKRETWVKAKCRPGQEVVIVAARLMRCSVVSREIMGASQVTRLGPEGERESCASK